MLKMAVRTLTALNQCNFSMLKIYTTLFSVLCGTEADLYEKQQITCCNPRTMAY